MKRILCLAGVLCVCMSVRAQFPGTDSLHRYNNRHIRNSPLEAFTQLRLNTLIHGIIQWIDSARAGAGGALGIDTAYQINDSTIRYRKNGQNFTFITKGIYDYRRKVDSAFAFNDSIVRVLINGNARDILIRGKDVRKIADTLIKIGTDTVKVGGTGGSGTEAIDVLSLKRSGKLYSKIPVATTLSALRAIPSGERDSGFIYRTTINGNLGEFYYDPSDNATPDDSVMVIAPTSGGGRFKRNTNGVVYARDFGATANNPADDDAPAISKLFRWLKRQNNSVYKVQLDQGSYHIDGPIQLPDSNILRQKHITLLIEGTSTSIYARGNNYPIFDRRGTTTNHTILNYWMEAYAFHIKGIDFFGEVSGSGQTGIALDGSYNSSITNCHFYALDTAISQRFSLNPTISDNWFQSVRKVCIYGGTGAGAWSGATICTSGFNKAYIARNRFYNHPGAFAAIMIENGIDFNIYDNISEGNHPYNHIWASGKNSDCQTNNYIEKFYVESTGGIVSKPTIIHWEGRNNLYVKDLDAHISNAIIMDLRDALTSTQTNRVIFDGFRTPVVDTAFRFTGLAGETEFTFKNITLGGGFYDWLYLPKTWGGTIPYHLSIDGYSNQMNQRIVGSSIDLFLTSGQRSPGSWSNIWTRGRLIADQDNVYDWGGFWPFSQNRPRAIYAGTLGVVVDTLGRYGFGTPAGGIRDVTIGRDAPGRIAILSTQTYPYEYRDFKARRGIFTAPSGYDSDIPIENLGINDFVTRSQLEANISSPINVSQPLIGDPYNPEMPLGIDTTSPEGVATKSDLSLVSTNAVDSLSKSPSGDSIRVFRKGSHIYSIKDQASGTGIDDVAVDGVTIKGNGTSTPLYSDTIAVIATKSDLDNIPVIPFPGLFAGSGISITGNSADGYTIVNTGSPGTNAHNALDGRNFGMVANATVPASGDIATGTNNLAALQAMINAAADGQLCIIPNGNYFINGTLDTIKGSKRVYLLVIGNLYLAKKDFIIITNGSGPYENHNIAFLGQVFNQVNMPSHTKTSHDNGTGPQWATFTGTLVKIFNTFQQTVFINYATGFKNVVEIIGGGPTAAANLGSQENRIVGNWFYKNANGVTFTSTTGYSYCDKNIVDVGKISGGLGIKFDGYEPAVAVGAGSEQYNGAFRSNSIRTLLEQCDSLIDGSGDITYNTFELTNEGGLQTNVFGNSGIRFPNTGPNIAKYNKLKGNGVIAATWLAKGFGKNNTIEQPITYNQNIIAYGGESDESGWVILEVDPGLDQATRDLLSTAIFKFRNKQMADKEIILSGTSYTVPDSINHVYATLAGTLVTLNNAVSRPGASVTVYARGNFFTRVTATGSSLETGAEDTVIARGSITYTSRQGKWFSTAGAGTYMTGTGGSGGGSGDVSSNITSTTSGRMTTFSGSTGKLVTHSTGTGFAKFTSGVPTFQTGINIADINATGGTSTSYLRKDGTWATPSGGGGGDLWQYTLNGSDIFWQARAIIGSTGNPTARLDLIGSTSAGLAALKIRGNPTTVPENNAFGENHGSYFSLTLENTRQKILTDYNFAQTTGLYGQVAVMINDANYTVADGIGVVVYNTATAQRTVTLPNAATYPNREIRFRNGTANQPIVFSPVLQAGNGFTSAGINQAQSVLIKSINGQWWVISD